MLPILGCWDEGFDTPAWGHGLSRHSGDGRCAAGVRKAQEKGGGRTGLHEGSTREDRPARWEVGEQGRWGRGSQGGLSSRQRCSGNKGEGMRCASCPVVGE